MSTSLLFRWQATWGVAVGSQPALYRNSAGASFPYTIANMASITGSTASSGYYYFFYNWQVKELTCLSPRIKVDALVDICASVNENDLTNNVSIYPNPTQNEFNIAIPSILANKGLKATIINSVGQVVAITPLQTEKTLINTSNWAKGIYLIQIPLDGQVNTYRLIVD
ncbi:T9SS type A sorting domain-containing protein [bacterium SCSIO 12643]|nr:T9SS type A sorting domain-containing protein [bacterium SCSIO 12643]